MFSICTLSLNAQENEPTYHSLIKNTLNFYTKSRYNNDVLYDPSFFLFLNKENYMKLGIY